MLHRISIKSLFLILIFNFVFSGLFAMDKSPIDRLRKILSDPAPKSISEFDQKYGESIRKEPLDLATLYALKKILINIKFNNDTEQAEKESLIDFIENKIKEKAEKADLDAALKKSTRTSSVPSIHEKKEELLVDEPDLRKILTDPTPKSISEFNQKYGKSIKNKPLSLKNTIDFITVLNTIKIDIKDKKSLDEKKSLITLMENKRKEALNAIYQKEQEKKSTRTSSVPSIHEKKDPTISEPSKKTDKEIITEFTKGQGVKKTLPTLPAIPAKTTRPAISTIKNYKNSKEKLAALLEFAKSNKIIDESKNSINVNGITNKVYQLKVKGQKGATCALHALYNCYVLRLLFDSSELNKEKATAILKMLNDNSVIKFIEDSKKFTDNETDWLISEQMQNIITNYKKEDNALKFKNISAIDGYELLSTEGPADFQGKSNVYFSGWLLNKPVDYYYGLASTLGEAERGILGEESLGHWISIFAVKTGEKEYSWFVMDSMGGNYINNGIVSDILQAYIYKFLGSSYKLYEDFLSEQHAKIDKKRESNDSIAISGLIREYSDELKNKKDSSILTNQIKAEIAKFGRPNAINDLFATKLVDLSEFKHYKVSVNMDSIGKINTFLSQLNKDLQELMKFRWEKTRPDLKKLKPEELNNYLTIFNRIENCNYPEIDKIKERVKGRISRAHRNLIEKVQNDIIMEISSRS